MSLLLIFYFGLFFAQKINLTTADLGRHLTNGKVFLKQGIIISTNFYSYTEPNFPVVTHHWLSGVVFYLLNSAVGFTGLSWFYVLVSGLTVYLFYKTAYVKSDFHSAVFFTLLMIPLISDRKEIRPEGFSYLFMGVYYYLLTLYFKRKINLKYLLPAIIIIQILWVNLHLFFIIGIFIIGIFTSREFISKFILKKYNKFKETAILFTVTVIVSLINPYGITGLLEPFNILKEYGYMIIENQTVFFMQKRAPSFVFFQVEFLSAMVILTVVHILINKKWRQYFVSGLLVLAFIILSFRAIRGIPIFGLFFVPFAAQYFYKNFRKYTPKLSIISVLVFVTTLIPGNYFSFVRPGFGFGLISGINDSANFFEKNNLTGPIFNNYDIGGYLIYHLYGQEKVFVDNRPEAYSVAFFKNVYIPAQEDEKAWQEVSQKYHFNTIYFYRRDATPWAQPFLIERIKDPEWIPVYVDNYVLILVKNNGQNQDIIKAHALPKNMFVVTPT